MTPAHAEPVTIDLDVVTAADGGPTEVRLPAWLWRRVLLTGAAILCLFTVVGSVRGTPGLGPPLWTGNISLNGFSLGSDSLYLAAPSGTNVVSRDLRTGRPRWRLDIPDLPDQTIDVGNGVAAVVTQRFTSSTQLAFSGRPNEMIAFVRERTGAVIARTVGYLNLLSRPGLPLLVYTNRPRDDGACHDPSDACLDVTGWDMRTGTPVWHLSLPPGSRAIEAAVDGHTDGLLEVAETSRSATLPAAETSTTPNPETPRPATSPDSETPRPATSPDSETPRPATSPDETSRSATSPDSGNTMRLYDLATGQPVGTAKRPTADFHAQLLAVRDAVITARRDRTAVVMTAYARPALQPMWSVSVPAPDLTVNQFSGYFAVFDCGGVLCLNVDGRTSQLVDVATGSVTRPAEVEVRTRLRGGGFVAADISAATTISAAVRADNVYLVSPDNHVLTRLPGLRVVPWADSGGQALLTRSGPARTGFAVVDGSGRVRELGSVTGTGLTCSARAAILACSNGAGELRVWAIP
jgi:hypothetical protein